MQALPDDVPAPPLVILLSGPATRPSPTRLSTARHPPTPCCTPSTFGGLGALYADDLPLADPRISPINGRLDRFERVAIYIGTRDILLHDAERLRDRFIEAGVEVIFERYGGMPHDWMLMPIPEAHRQLNHAAALLRAPRPPGPSSAR